jgi:Ku70/Ku80 beta-barrel domain
LWIALNLVRDELRCSFASRPLPLEQKGNLKLSLVSCPIALFPSTSEREKISFHQINKTTGHRIKYQKVDADTGAVVGSDDIIKGYEVGKGQYIQLQPEELEAVAIERAEVARGPGRARRFPSDRDQPPDYWLRVGGWRRVRLTLRLRVLG